LDAIYRIARRLRAPAQKTSGSQRMDSFIFLQKRSNRTNVQGWALPPPRWRKTAYREE
jgi:hypothetical protein